MMKKTEAPIIFLWVMVYIFFAMSLGFILSGCATSVTRLEPIVPSEGAYAGYTCEQLEQFYINNTSEIRLLASRQETKQARDKTKMVANFLLLPVFWGVGDDENTEKLKIALGEYQAVIEQVRLNNCGFKILTIEGMVGE